MRLLFLAFWIKIKNVIEQIEIIRRYWKDPLFRSVDITFTLSYLFTNPYRVSRRFSQAKDESNIYTYGETPLTTMELICKECGVTSCDTVYELGCGRALTCFWMRTIVGAKVVGVDYLPLFIDKAREIARKYRLKDISFSEEDILEGDYREASVVYFYGICMEDEILEKLAKRLSQMQKGAKLITVSFPITDYQKKKTFSVEKAFWAPFPWGTAKVYVQIRD